MIHQHDRIALLSSALTLVWPAVTRQLPDMRVSSRRYKIFHGADDAKLSADTARNAEAANGGRRFFLKMADCRFTKCISRCR